jgi:hypothetical protein
MKFSPVAASARNHYLMGYFIRGFHHG